MPGSATPTSGTRPRPPQRPAARSSRRAEPGAYFAGPRLGRDKDSTPRTSRSSSAPGEGALQRLPRGLAHFSEPQATPESSPNRPGSRHPSLRFPPRDTPCRAGIRSRGELLTPRGGHTPLSLTPSGAHTPAGPAPIPHRTNMSGSVTGHPPPRSTPAARAASAPGSDAAGRSPERERRAAPAREGAAPPGTHRQLGRRGVEVRDGQRETQYGRAPQLLPAASSSRLREDAATSRQRQLRWRPRQHHIPLPLASSTPSPFPTAMATRRQGD